VFFLHRPRGRKRRPRRAIEVVSKFTSACSRKLRCEPSPSKSAAAHKIIFSGHSARCRAAHASCTKTEKVEPPVPAAGLRSPTWICPERKAKNNVDNRHSTVLPPAIWISQSSDFTTSPVSVISGIGPPKARTFSKPMYSLPGFISCHRKKSSCFPLHAGVRAIEKNDPT